MKYGREPDVTKLGTGHSHTNARPLAAMGTSIGLGQMRKGEMATSQMTHRCAIGSAVEKNALVRPPLPNAVG